MKKFLLKSTSAVALFSAVLSMDANAQVKLKNTPRTAAGTASVGHGVYVDLTTVGTALYKKGTYAWVGGTNTGGVGGNSAGQFVYLGEGIYDIYMAGEAYEVNSTAVTEARVAENVSKQFAGLLESRTASKLGTQVALADSSTMFAAASDVGMSAGDTMSKIGVWAKVNYTHMKDTSSGFNWDANAIGGALGADYAFNPKVLAGLALTYSNLDGKTQFNNGKINDNAFGVAPYVGVKLLERGNFGLMLDLSAGWSRVDKDRKRTQKLYRSPAESVTTDVTSSPKSNRYFGKVQLGASHKINKVTMGLDVGYFYTVDKQKAFTESNGTEYTAGDNEVAQVLSRLQAMFHLHEKFAPFIFGTCSYDLTRTKIEIYEGNTTAMPKVNKSMFGGGLGFHFKATDKVTGGLESQYQKQSNFSAYSVMGNVRYQF